MERLAAAGLQKEIESIVRRSRVSLRDLYEGPRMPTIVAARRVVYARLMMRGKGINEISRLFDRASNSISKLMRAKQNVGETA